jgi:two-component system, NtrC family, nitrogen regulation sensor histidine kinase NtrY
MNLLKGNTMSLLKRTQFSSSIVLALVAVFSALLLQRAFPVIESEESFSSNIGFFLLINVNIIAVMILGFIVVRNIIRLLVDRRNNILGARLRSRLVFAFIMLSMVPTVLLFFVAQGLVEKVLQDWFSPKVEMAIDAARTVGQNYYDVREEYLEHVIREIDSHTGSAVATERLETASDQSMFVTNLLNELKTKYTDVAFSLFTVNNKGQAGSAHPGLEAPFPVSRDILADTGVLQQNNLVQPEEYAGTEYIRGYYVPSFSSRHNESYLIVLSIQIPAQITDALTDLLTAGDEYEEFKSYRRPLASSYFLTLVVVTLLVIFAAISVGFFLAKSLAVPIGLLAKGTEQVAHGNLSYKIPELGDDELGVLVRAFNKMTSDLKEATDELISRTRYIETVLANVGVGVLSIDSQNILKTCNHSAFQILEIDTYTPVLDRDFKEVLPEEIVSVILEITKRSLRGKSRMIPKSFFYPVGGRVKHIQVMVSKLYEESRSVELGMVVLLDDVTEFERAQRMAAWQEVARRIAHEIKNPLTPIQLSAERVLRLKTRLKPDSLSDEESGIIDESARVIMTQVENLRVLVNEFSQFARMPKSERTYGNVNLVLKSAVETYSLTVSDIRFTLQLDDSIPDILLDGFQMERVFVNLLDNAIASVREAQPDDPHIIVTSEFDFGSSIVILQFKDNGTGLSNSDKSKMFEPYFTKKKGGTGLGLAIVKTVVSDHNGFIRVFDGEGGGLVVRIEIPVVK